MTRLLVGATVLLALGAPALGEIPDMRLRYLSRYETHWQYHDHLVSVEQVGAHYAIVGSNMDLVLIDLEQLPGDGTSEYVFRYEGVDVYDTLTRDDGIVFVNLRQSGFMTMRFDEDALTLTHLDTVHESGVLYETMAVVGDLLYVPAHAHGLRIFDVRDPSSPQLIGVLEEGLDDAFAVAIDGPIAYVADGAGGLKLVNVSNPAAPFVIGGEDPQSAAGTAQDVEIVNGHVYMACGGDGVAAYPAGKLAARAMFDTPGSARRLARIGDRLAAADMKGVSIYDIQPDGLLDLVAGESGERRTGGPEDVWLRLWYGVDAWGDDRVLTANWDSLDVYRLVDRATDDQPDITTATGRLRFPATGGTCTVRLRNDGSAPLQISSIHATEPTFAVSATTATLATDEVLEFDVTYLGGQPGEARLVIDSNDPDEKQLPIELYGATEFLDPGEPAYPFTLPSRRFDHDTDSFVPGTFDLVSHEGQVIFIHIYGLA